MKLCALFSGGKDSTMAVYKAKKEGHEVSVLLSMLPESKESYMYHVPNIELTTYSAEAMEIQLVQKKTSGKPPEENKDMKEALREIKKIHGIEGVAAGAVASKYQYGIVSEACRGLDLRTYAPYWGVSHEELIREAIAAGFVIVFVGVSAEGFDETWLGRRLDENALAELIELRKKYGINVGGEGGEYETLVLDGPIFRKRLEIKKSKKIWEKTRGELLIEEVELIPKPQYP